MTEQNTDPITVEEALKLIEMALEDCNKALAFFDGSQYLVTAQALRFQGSPESRGASRNV